MDKSKLIKIGGLVLTIIGAIVGLASDKLEDMKLDEMIDEKLNERLNKASDTEVKCLEESD